MNQIKNLRDWCNNFDNQKYPTEIYDELIIEKKENRNKMLLMGAWKTGSLRTSNIGKEYEDKNGIHYIFTNRWKETTPVGYKTWKYISDNYESLTNRIPYMFSKEEPEVVLELKNKQGFGFIWTVFFLHCAFPDEYPLYDQHVYRAYKYILSDGKKITKMAPNNWSEYRSYKLFFEKTIKDKNMSFWEMDRALWAFGKAKKQENIIIEKKKDPKVEIKAVDKEINVIPIDTNCYISSFTLGGKKKVFWWKIDEHGTIYINRRFISSEEMIQNVIYIEELESLNKYVKTNGWVALGNNVEKLNNKTEVDGLGKFLCEALNWKSSDAQIVSQIAVIFVMSGVWIYNGKKRGMEFKSETEDWKNMIEKYFHEEMVDSIFE